ncbi:EmrB/QacA subfamily drug resistance transporter [Nonomuraea polychroma]|uniref:EmrB/QacA subfamily drug resistance transporter n=1 Tax=Nonomuraea polychroma TaxID=46176 RepID=A0A438M1Z6_9ACTN|nr:MFS transporter [Nonomuraea polychroma]RVX39784.1 EmrB/QacA subfamily drug resistance transporter [Nonomuraea polychroma]
MTVVDYALRPIAGSVSPVRARTRTAALAVVAVAPFVANADAGIVALALPDIQRDLDMTLTAAQWVTNVYVLLVGGFQLLGGRLADIVGRRRLFLTCLLGFVLASAMCGAATDGPWLIAGRAFQAVSAALLIPAAMAIMIAMFTDPAERSRAVGIWGTVGGIGAITGTCAGGVVVSQFDWRWGFYVNIPIGVAILVTSLRLVPKDGTERARGADVPGAACMTGGLLAMVYGFVRAAEHGWADPFTLAILAGGAILLIAFALIQSRASHPLVPPALVRNRRLVCGAVGVLLVSAATIPVIVVGSLYLQRVHGAGALTAGFMLVPVVGMVLLVGPLGTYLLNRLGPRVPYLLGWAAIGGGLLLLTRLAPDSAYLTDILPGLVLVGVGMPFAWINSEVVATSSADERTAGLAAGVVQAAAQIGAAIGLAIAMTAANTYAAGRLAQGADPLTALSDGVARAFLLAAVLTIPAVLNAIVGMRRANTADSLQ